MKCDPSQEPAIAANVERRELALALALALGVFEERGATVEEEEDEEEEEKVVGAVESEPLS